MSLATKEGRGMFEFYGDSAMNLDTKGRLTVPTRYQDALRTNALGELTVTRNPDGCLMVFPRPEWVRFRDKVATLPMTHQWLKRLFLGSASDVTLDSAGRILISPELRQATDIARETLLRGMGNYFELWDKTTYQAQEAQAAAEGKFSPPENFSY
jgi:MraZ protein